MFKEYYGLCFSDEDFAEVVRTAEPDASEQEIEALLRYRERRRREHPFFKEPPRDEAGGSRAR